MKEYSKDEIIEKMTSSLNYYNVDEDDLKELLDDDLSEEELKEISDAVISINTLLFKCE